MIHLILFALLMINVAYQYIAKSSLHFSLLKKLELIGSDENLLVTFMTGTFYKYPSVIFPYVESFENLEGEKLIIYKKVKRSIRNLWLAIILLITYFSILWVVYPSSF
jgi:hypothetical protein